MFKRLFTLCLILSFFSNACSYVIPGIERCDEDIKEKKKNCKSRQNCSCIFENEFDGEPTFFKFSKIINREFDRKEVENELEAYQILRHAELNQFLFPLIKICQIIETRNKEEVGQGEEEEFTKRVVMILKKTGVSIKENINSLRKDIDPQEKIFSRAFLERFIEIVDALITFQGFDIFPIGLESDSLRVDEDGILFSDFGKALKTDKNKNKNDDDLVKRKNLQIRSFARLLSKFLEEHKEALNEEVFEKLDEYVNKLKKYDEKNKYHYILHERNVLTVIIVFHILMK